MSRLICDFHNEIVMFKQMLMVFSQMFHVKFKTVNFILFYMYNLPLFPLPSNNIK